MVAPLKGYKVLELATMITGPLAGMMLGDLGAEVIKVEREGGDPFRHFNGSTYSPQFVAFNRNKSSLVLNLQSPEGLAKVLELAADSDVLIDNFRPGVLDKLGLGTEALRRANPRLIHCSITGFGATGPYMRRPAYDTVGQALSGLSSLSISPDAPRLVGATVSDNVTGMYACYAIMAALLERQSTGQGRRIEVNMLEASAAFMPDTFMNLEMLKLCNGPTTRVSFSQAYVAKCADGKLLTVHLSSQDRFWLALLQALGAPALAEDPRFTTREERIANHNALAEALGLEFARRPLADWVERLEASDVPFAPVLNARDVMTDPQVAALGSFRKMELANGQHVSAIQVPVLFDGKRPDAWSAPPLLKA